jgi:hypothetical protein
MIDNDKHSSLLQIGINYDHKKFYSTGPCMVFVSLRVVLHVVFDAEDSLIDMTV